MRLGDMPTDKLSTGVRDSGGTFAGKARSGIARRASDQLRAYKAHKELILILLPGLIVFLVFAYGPMYGLVIAFKDYRVVDGIWGSKWVGLENFRYLFDSPEFLNAFKNDLIFVVLKYLFEFPAPIVLALLLNELRFLLFKRVFQTVSYLPHFFSWVVMASILFMFLASDGGLNQFLGAIGIHTDNSWLLDPGKFKGIVVIGSIWKSVGWGSIIYLAALSAIDPGLYEAAAVDGAGRWHRVRHITLPSIMPVVIIMLLLSIGQFLSVGFDEIYNLMTPTTEPTGDIIATYTLRRLFGLDYSVGAASGLFTSAIGLTMVVISNRIVKWYDSDQGLW